MSCPDWQLLSRTRDENEAAWNDALLHFDGCDRCRGQAIEAEPTLLFRGMSSPQADRLGSTDEIESIKSAVATMRRAETYREQRKSSRWSPSALRAASLAALLVSAGLLQGSGTSVQDGPVTLAESQGNGVLAWAPMSETDTLGEPASQSFSETRSLEQIPLVEDVDPAYGSIIQVIDQDISLLVVVPTSLDV